jgi:hypothetical protein
MESDVLNIIIYRHFQRTSFINKRDGHIIEPLEMIVVVKKLLWLLQDYIFFLY